MSHYVYQYLHPEYGHLYCGRTEDLDRRIYEHNNLERDNISRDYEVLLKESIVMYIELKNKAQEIAVEAYCIDKYKPYLNKSLKYNDDNDFILEMKLPKWNIYDPQKSRYKQQLLEANEEAQKLDEEISNIETIIKKKKDKIHKMKFEFEKINYEIEIRESNNNDDVLFGFKLNDIKWFYEFCENKNVKFYSDVYDKIGNKSCSGYIYFDLDKNMLALEMYDENNNDSLVFENFFGFEIIASTLHVFYPDTNIYPELHAVLLSKNNELLIKNATYDLKDLMDNYDNQWIDSIDRSISVIFVNGEINCCRIDDIFYEKQAISSDMQDYIFSFKYYRPDRSLKEEEYCNEMLLRYNN